jgi:hypothetical protein
VVIADKPLTEYVPLGRVTGKTDVITQWSMGDVEAAGLLKMDFLGLPQLDDPVEGGRVDSADDGQNGRSVHHFPPTIVPRTRSCNAAKPKAFSSSKAAASATCCKR